MDPHAVGSGLSQAIPFYDHVGLEFIEISDGRASVRMAEAPHLSNHLGSQHAGALFAVGEAASGAALVGAFADDLLSIIPVARRAEIGYRRLARGPVVAEAVLSEDPALLRERLAAADRVEFEAEVAIRDGRGRKVTEMTVDWLVRRA